MKLPPRSGAFYRRVGYNYEYTDPANGRDTSYNWIRGLRRPTGKSEALSRVHAEACSGSTPGRPSQCRRAKVWATKKNPGIVVSIWQKACHGARRHKMPHFSRFLQQLAQTVASRVGEYCLDSIQSLSKNRARRRSDRDLARFRRRLVLDRVRTQIYSAIAGRRSLYVPRLMII